MVDVRTDANLTSAESHAWAWHLADGISVDSARLGADPAATSVAGVGRFADQVVMAIAATIANMCALQQLAAPTRPVDAGAFAKLACEIATLAARIRSGSSLPAPADVRLLAEAAARNASRVVDVNTWAEGLAGDLSTLDDR